VARYLLGKWFDEQPWGQDFPSARSFINVSGSFILGAAAAFILERLSPAHQNWYLLFGTGFCGGYTTFSTFEWETYKLIRDGSWWYALANCPGQRCGWVHWHSAGRGPGRRHLPQTVRRHAMKVEADAKLVTIYVNSTDQWHGRRCTRPSCRLCQKRASPAPRWSAAWKATAPAATCILRACWS